MAKIHGHRWNPDAEPSMNNNIKIAICLGCLLLIYFIVMGVTLSKYEVTIDKQKKQIEQLNSQIDKQKELIKAIDTYPSWYKAAYFKCNGPEVPENFRKECIAFELRR